MRKVGFEQILRSLVGLVLLGCVLRLILRRRGCLRGLGIWLRVGVCPGAFLALERAVRPICLRAHAAWVASALPNVIRDSSSPWRLLMAPDNTTLFGGGPDSEELLDDLSCRNLDFG